MSPYIVLSDDAIEAHYVQAKAVGAEIVYALKTQDYGGKAYSYALDVSDRFQVYAVADKIRKEVGDVTMLINNAGITTGEYLLDCPDEKVIKTMEVNALAHFWVSTHVL